MQDKDLKKWQLTSPRRINLIRRDTSRGGLTFGELLNLLTLISSEDRI